MPPSRIVKLPHQNVSEIVEKSPRLARILWFSTMVDASIHREWLVNLGGRKGVVRAAHLFCEMLYRLKVVEMSDASGYDFPITQVELGESLGLTSVHINRVLRELRESGLVTFHGKRVTIHNQEALEQFAGFDPQFLYLDPKHG